MSLWKVIDIQPRQAVNPQIVKIIRTLGGDHTEVLRISCFQPNGSIPVPGIPLPVIGLHYRKHSAIPVSMHLC